MKKLLSILAVAAPSVAFAQPLTNIDDVTFKFTNIGNTVIQILIAFAVIYIIYSVIIFLINGDNEDKRKAARGSILWGIVGLFVILSIWGLVRILTNSFRTDTNAPTNDYPRVQYPSQI